MRNTDIAIVLAMGAALLIAVGDVFQQRSAHQVTDEPVGHAGLLLRLLADKQWWFGSLVATAGFGLQAAALGFGSVLLVQALLVTSLLFALPLSARFAGRRITRIQRVWALALAAAIAVVVTVGNPARGQSRAGLDTWIGVLVALGPALAVCLVGARVLAGRPLSAVLLGLASGSLWGVFAVLTVGVVDELDQGIRALLTMPELYGWAVVALAATTVQQSAFRAGSMAASLPAVAVSEPLVGSLLGVAVLRETFQPGESGWIILVAAFVVMVLAIVVLARGEAVDDSAADANPCRAD